MLWFLSTPKIQSMSIRLFLISNEMIGQLMEKKNTVFDLLIHALLLALSFGTVYGLKFFIHGSSMIALRLKQFFLSSTRTFRMKLLHSSDTSGALMMQKKCIKQCRYQSKTLT